ncbi:MAG: DUF411 domain-containing protein [Leptolyngbya sp. DLM2.Bin15]|nr:MAG: DUF411 domain-containing protein [Leptolyngbya sp. DLM2.Bin15]
MKRRWFTSRLLGISLGAASLMATACASAAAPTTQKSLAPEKQSLVQPKLIVFRSPTCSCCGQWVEHMEAAGFRVEDHVTDDMTAIKQQYGVPDTLSSCHTALVGGYVIEGHVPASDVQRLLREQPDVVGLAVPGMPIGSPGMEMGDEVEPYTVIAFTQTGETLTFAEHL